MMTESCDVHNLWTRDTGLPIDTRQFAFALICNNCDVYKNITITHHHETDVECEHCGLLVSYCGIMALHLKQKQMHSKLSCKPKYRIPPCYSPLFHRLPSQMRSTKLGKVAAKAASYNSLQNIASNDVLALSVEVAGIKRMMMKQYDDTLIVGTTSVIGAAFRAIQLWPSSFHNIDNMSYTELGHHQVVVVLAVMIGSDTKFLGYVWPVTCMCKLVCFKTIE